MAVFLTGGPKCTLATSHAVCLSDCLCKIFFFFFCEMVDAADADIVAVEDQSGHNSLLPYRQSIGRQNRLVLELNK